MTNEYEAPEEYTIVSLKNGMCINVMDGRDSVDAQTQKHLESLGKVDYFVHLTNIDGDTVRTLASTIDGIFQSSTQGRRNNALFRAAQSREAKAFREEAGILPGEDDY